MVEVCGHHLHSVPPPPSKRLGYPVPEALEAVILSCLEKDPTDRPPSAAALLESLERLLGGAGWTPAEALERWEQRAARCELPEAGPHAVDNSASETVSSFASAGDPDRGPDGS